jgi:hypothetical protein
LEIVVICRIFESYVNVNKQIHIYKKYLEVSDLAQLKIGQMVCIVESNMRIKMA